MLNLPEITYLSIVGNKTDKPYSDIDSILKIGQKTSRHINFGKKIIYTIEEPTIDVGDFEIEIIKEIPYENFTKYVLKNYFKLFATKYMINFHTDGFIRNPSAWDDSFLNFDYIGAPMHHQGFLYCGNGGFSLRSYNFCKRVSQLYEKHESLFSEEAEDLITSFSFNQALVFEGFKYADINTCSNFSTEHHSPDQSKLYTSFGMHEIEKLFNEKQKNHRRKYYNYIFNDFSIKKMILEDVPFYNEVRNDCRQMLHNTSKYTKEESIKWFKETNPNFYTIKMNDEKIGYFRTSNENNLFFVGMDLHKSKRGLGLAKQLYYDFFEMIEEDDIYLLVKKQNKTAINLYKDIGFIEKEIEGFTIDTESFLMHKKLK